MKETELQKHLVDGIIANGGFGTKLDANFIHGLSDLYMVHPMHPGAFIEVKINSGRKSEAFMKLGETSLQREFIQKVIKGGGYGGFLMCFDRPNGKNIRKYHVIWEESLIMSDETLTSSLAQCQFTQHFGQGYPSLSILKTITEGQP